ncbi:MAG: alcohol dehydrogenase catalytic domain-containing protein [Spongiibacteraceae bacterium]|nr:alcohol dehydrogenase catalytic domain-containing protein [Spongiibacteraceae bacterium]
MVERSLPARAADEVVVAVRAAGINPSDVKNVLGSFPHTSVPRVPGHDFAGVVTDGPAELIGQAVWGGSGEGFGFSRDGCHAQYVSVPVSAIAPKPDTLSYAAATCGVPYITAWDALERSQWWPELAC